MEESQKEKGQEDVPFMSDDLLETVQDGGVTFEGRLGKGFARAAEGRARYLQLEARLDDVQGIHDQDFRDPSHASRGELHPYW